MSKPYCGGLDKAPKGSYLGSESDCIKRVSRYGLIAVDKAVLQLSKIDVEKERIKMFGLKGKIQKLQNELDYNLIQINRDKVTEKDKKKYKESNKQIMKEIKDNKKKVLEISKIIKGVKKEEPKPQEMEEDDPERKPLKQMTKLDLKILITRYKTRFERIKKELEIAPKDKQLIKDKEEAYQKYLKYKEQQSKL